VERLVRKRLVIVAGKGGVGKTTTSAAIALHLARQGRKTLLVTVDPAKRLEDSLGVPVGFRETPVQPRLAAMMLDPGAIIKEHLESRLPQARITEHPLFRYVTNYLPGLNELMAIGKLNDLRRADAYDCIVVDTAPTGHALSFLAAPQGVKEMMREGSLVKWAVRGYAVWQRMASAAGKVGNVFRKEADRKTAPPEIDFEKVFGEIGREAERIQAFLTDPEHSALVLVTLPEKLPVEETCDLHEAVTRDLGMRVEAVVVNKVQPDPLAQHRARFERVAAPGPAQRAFRQKAAAATGEDPGLFSALLAAAEFGRIRREMNLENIAELGRRLPQVPQVLLPLFKHDVQGLKRLGEFRAALFDPANRQAVG
jgi:TRC40/GET3/ArsA family transport-energizing ATPase